MEQEEVTKLVSGDALSVCDDQMRILVAIFQEFATSLDIDSTLHHATSLIRDYLGAEAASLFLLSDDETELVCTICSGPIDIIGMRIASDLGIVGRAIRENRTQIVRDVSRDSDFNVDVDDTTGFVTRSILCAPLQIQSKNFGALEIINKKRDGGLFNEADKHLLTALANSASLAIHNARMAQELVIEERTRRDLELARDIQSSFLPVASGPHSPIHGINLPARAVSGDFYDYFTNDNGLIYFALGDVAGKGVNASLLMSKTTSLFRCLGKLVDSPGLLLERINNELNENLSRGMFVTMVVGLFNPETGSMQLANAGHNPPLLADSSGHFEQLDFGSPPLGVVPGVRYGQVEVALNGGALYLYTDGLTEIWEERDKQMGIEGLKKHIKKHNGVPRHQRLDNIVSSVTKWKMENSGYLFDDVTMLLVEI